MTTTTLPHDARRLAAALKELDLPGKRSMTAITALRRQRAQRTAPLPAPLPPAERLAERLTSRYAAEIERRGGETAIADKSTSAPLRLADRRGAMVLLHAAGWRYYSSRFGSRYAELSYLAGQDDNGDWAVRVPGTITTIAAALQWLEPAEVRDARAAGLQVARQGDVYAVQAKRDAPAGTVADTHHWNPATRYLTHTPADGGRKHRPLRIAHPVRFVPQRPLAMGRTGGRGAGD